MHPDKLKNEKIVPGLENELSLGIIYFMRRFLSVLCLSAIAVPASYTICQAQLKNGWQNPYDKTIWYKRYTGTINGNPVNVNLVLWDYYMTGSYNFSDKSDQAEIYINKKDTSVDGKLTVYGFAPSAQFADTAGSKSIISFKGDRITGLWESAGHIHTAAIELKESYPEGTYPFDLAIHKDSILVNNNLSGMYSTYKIPMPGRKMKKQDAEWFEKALAKELGGDGAASMAEYIKTTDKNEFASYKRLMDDSLGSYQNFSLTMVIEPFYNNHGIVVLKADYYVAIPRVSTRESYYCMDVEHKKILHLGDIMNVDTTKLNALLEDDMRAWYSPMHPDYKGPYASVTNDIYVTDFGVTFLFGNNDFLNTPCFFVPYSKLKDMLKPDFRKRMNL